MKQRLKQTVQQHYNAQRLDDTQLDALEALYSPTANENTHSNPQTVPSNKPFGLLNRYRYSMLTALAASFLLVFSLLFFYLQPDTRNEQRIMSIASEVVKEHLNQNPLEVSSAEFTTVQNYFNKLDFLPSTSELIDQQQLLGGRYCSIQNVTAAQIRYESTQSQYPTTLYQVSYDSGHFGTIPDIDQQGTPLTRYVKGVQVKVWVEKGLLMVLTQHTGGNS